MSANTACLTSEWERIAILGECLAVSREGKALSEEQLARLSGAQESVEFARAEHALWDSECDAAFSRLECDVLACSLGPEAEPSLALMFQGLQAGGVEPYPTVALVQELLALDRDETRELYSSLSPSAPLRRRRLIQIESVRPFAPIKPTSKLVSRLLGRDDGTQSPPGALPVEIAPTWNDLVLSSHRKDMLREFLAWVLHRKTVFGEWGGRMCGGPVALFSGPSGTGKTFGAAVVAAALGWPMYRIDLGSLVSKYIGETEERINTLFDFAHEREMVLLFDEADSLFGKRGEVKEARDRYANMEVSHLLSRIEEHEGPCILTTNLRDNLDNAFSRRFQVVVDFPRPDAAARTELWRIHLPPRAPLAADVDCGFLGNAVTLTGGGIRNAALHAAFLAADAGNSIGLPQIALAVWRELSKTGRELNNMDLGTLAEFLPKDVKPC